MAYYSDRILTCGHDQKNIYRTAKHLMGESGGWPPPDVPRDELAAKFSNFFTEKIVNVRSCLVPCNDCIAAQCDTPAYSSMLTSFSCISSEEVKKFIIKSPDKACDLDPVPTWVLKQCLSELLSLITAIVNTSLENGSLPIVFKCVQIKPLHKKPGLDPEVLKHYRSMSNLPFLSKVLKKLLMHKLSNIS